MHDTQSPRRFPGVSHGFHAHPQPTPRRQVRPDGVHGRRDTVRTETEWLTPNTEFEETFTIDVTAADLPIRLVLWDNLETVRTGAPRTPTLHRLQLTRTQENHQLARHPLLPPFTPPSPPPPHAALYGCDGG